MRVLYLLDSLNRGGAEMMALDVCRNARRNGLDLTLVTMGGGELENDFFASGVDYVRLRRRFPVDFGLVNELRKVIIARRISVVHCHQAVEALHAYLATRLTSTRIVLTLHGFIGNFRDRLALRFILPRMNATIAVSHESLKRFKSEERINAKFHVIHNGVDPLRLLPSGKSLKTELGLGEDQLLVGTTANFRFAVKNQLTICRALPEFFSRVQDVHFVFVGQRSPSAPRLYDDCVEFCDHKSIGGRVHFLGGRDDTPDLLSSFDIFVLSSLHEGFPIAAIEAMMMGVPTVLSDIGPMMEVSDSGACAATFRRGDPDDLARQLTRLIHNPILRAQLSLKAKTWSLANFTIETHIGNLVKLYTGLAEKG
jgi:glycosyltransferase involved in cell wall biosynthesis